MNELTPYEKELAEQSKKLPLPDKDAAWDKMKRLLDEDKDKGGAILPPPPNGINNLSWLWALLLFVIAGGAWVLLHSTKKSNLSSTNNSIETAIKENENSKDVLVAKNEMDSLTKENKNDIPVNTDKYKSTETENNKEFSIENKISKPTVNTDNGEQAESNDKTVKSKRKNHLRKPGLSTINSNKKNISGTENDKEEMAATATDENDQTDNKQNLPVKKKLAITKKGQFKSKITNATIDDLQGDETSDKKDPNPSIGNTGTLIAQNQLPLTDSVAKKDSIVPKPLITQKQDSSIATKKKKDNNKEKKHLWSAGIAFQQGIRTDCNCIYPDDNNKSTSSITDYIPSIFARFYPNKKWFVQAELKYAAPQFIREFMYKSNLQDKPYDVIATSYVLQQAYYHQFHLSFNYMVTPKWAVGLGATYNLFSSAVSQQDVRRKPYGIPDSLVSFTTITHLNNQDNVHFSDYWQTYIETQYKLNSFTLGLRYGVALHSYVTYINPFSASPDKRNNNSLNVFIRYELWNNKKK